jgi:putative lipoprotein
MWRSNSVIPVAFAVLAGVLGVSAEDRSRSNSRSELKGTVTYLERMLLPRAANVRIMVMDTTDQTKPTVVIDRLIPTEGRQVPIPFKIFLAKDSVDPKHSYTVRAEILIGGQVWFITKKAIPILTHDNPFNVHMVLDRSS